MSLNENKTINIDMFLMYEDFKIADLTLQLSHNWFYIMVTNIIDEKYLPFSVKNKKTNIQDFLILRCLPMNNHRNIFLVQFMIQDFTRDKYAPFLLSLLSNSSNLVDKYWLKPKEAIVFQYKNMHINFQHTNWNQVNPFAKTNNYDATTSFFLNDIFLSEFDNSKGTHVKSLNWATNGDAIKRWLIINDMYVLEKKLSEEQQNKEIETLEFFKKNNIKTPQYTIEHIAVEENYDKYDIDTIQNGYYSLKKECLTNTNTHLTSVIEYVDNDTTIENPIRKMCSLHNLSEDKIEHFLNTIRFYKEQFGIESDGLLDTRNFGLLVDKNGNAEPVVWSGLQLDPCPFNNFKNK